MRQARQVSKMAEVFACVNSIFELPGQCCAPERCGTEEAPIFKDTETMFGCEQVGRIFFFHFHL